MAKEIERSRYESGLAEDNILELAGHVETLSSQPEWRHYAEALKAVTIWAREQMAEGEVTDFAFWKGYIEGLKYARDFTPVLIALAASIRKRESQQDVGKKAVGISMHLDEGAPTF